MVTAAVLAGLFLTGLAASARGGGPPAPGPPAGIPAAGQAAGSQPALRLLARAARACRQLPFHGIEVLDWWGSPGTATSMAEVWHAPGRPALAGVPGSRSAQPEAVHRAVLPGDRGGPQVVGGAGMLGLSPRLVALLGANYRVAAAGTGRVAGRPAQVVAVRWPGGGLAALFWLDRATGLPLRRAVFDRGRREFGDARFLQVTVGATAPWPRLVAARPWGTRLSASRIASLRAAGWPLPPRLPGHLALLAAAAAATSSGPVFDLDYSDGLFAVSVFVQRGHLPAQMPGWSRIAVNGHPAFADQIGDRSIAWSAGGFVYTVLPGAPPQTARQVVASLSRARAPGFFGRVRNGVRHLLAWLSPWNGLQ